MRCPPHLILKHLNSSVVSLAQLISPSVALPAQIVLVLNQYKNNLIFNIHLVKQIIILSTKIFLGTRHLGFSNNLVEIQKVMFMMPPKVFWTQSVQIFYLASFLSMMCKVELPTNRRGKKAPLQSQVQGHNCCAGF